MRYTKAQMDRLAALLAELVDDERDDRQAWEKAAEIEAAMEERMADVDLEVFCSMFPAEEIAPVEEASNNGRPKTRRNK